MESVNFSCNGIESISIADQNFSQRSFPIISIAPGLSQRKIEIRSYKLAA